jgi:hypothetical protein
VSELTEEQGYFFGPEEVASADDWWTWEIDDETDDRQTYTPPLVNAYYTPTGWPTFDYPVISLPARSELALIAAGFAKLPPLGVNPNGLVTVNAAGNALSYAVGWSFDPIYGMLYNPTLSQPYGALLTTGQLTLSASVVTGYGSATLRSSVVGYLTLNAAAGTIQVNQKGRYRVNYQFTVSVGASGALGGATATVSYNVSGSEVLYGIGATWSSVEDSFIPGPFTILIGGSEDVILTAGSVVSLNLFYTGFTSGSYVVINEFSLELIE